MKNEPQLSAEMEKRFDEEFVQVCTNNDEGGHYDYPSLNTSSPIEIKNFLATALEEQKKAINDEWLYQKANDHDARIRADERKAVLAEVEGWIKAVQYDGMIDAEIMIQWIQTMKGKK